MAGIKLEGTNQNYRSRQALIADKVACHGCKQRFTLNDGIVSMPNYMNGEGPYNYHHYPSCPPIPPPAKGLAPGMYHNVQEGWE